MNAKGRIESRRRRVTATTEALSKEEQRKTEKEETGIVQDKVL